MRTTAQSLFDDGPATAEETAAADALAEYFDRFALGEEVDLGSLLRQHGPLSPQVQQDLRILDEIGAILDGTEPSLRYGDFEVIREIGRGGMGIVFEALQVSCDRRVALKILLPGLILDQRTFKRFEREAKIAASLRHPNLVPVYAMGVEGGTPYYAMELAEGETLQGFLVRRRSWFAQLLRSSCAPGTEIAVNSTVPGQDSKAGARAPDQPASSAAADDEEAWAMNKLLSSRHGPAMDGWTYPEYCRSVARAFAGAAEGLQHVHAQRILHRDLKPANLLLGADGCLRILDFGLAWAEDQSRLTRTRERVGTLLYMSPEQADSICNAAVRHGPALDIYGLGAALYETLVGRPPIVGKNIEDLLRRIQHEDPRPLQRYFPVPPDLEKVVLKCLRKRPTERYATAEALAQDLQRFLRVCPCPKSLPKNTLN